MKRDEYLRIVKKRIRYVFDRNSIAEELAQHIEDSIEDLMADGLSKEEAEAQAIAQMGDPRELGNMLNEEHHPKLGYTYMISKFVMLFLLCYVLAPILANLVGMLFLPKIDNKVAEYEINIREETPIFLTEIRKLVFTEDGDSIITYRAWRKYNYTRTQSIATPVFITGSSGEQVLIDGEGGYGFFGAYCSSEFKWPEDNLLVITLDNGERIQIDLEEYIYEQKK